MAIPSILFLSDPQDARALDALERQVRAQFGGQVKISSFRSVLPGEATAEFFRRAVLESDTIVVVVTARLFDNRFQGDQCLGWALRRHRAGDVNIIAVQASPCAIDRRLADVPIIPIEGRRVRNLDVWAHNAAEAIAGHAGLDFPRRPRYESAADRESGDALSRADWEARFAGTNSTSETPSALSLVRLVPGEMMLRRFWLIRRLSIRAAREIWEVYDRAQEARALLHVFSDAGRATCDALREHLTALQKVRHPSNVRVLMGLEEDRARGVHCAAEELVAWSTLREVVLRDAAQPHGLDHALASVAEVIAEAHSVSLFHGQLSPDNILCGPKKPSPGVALWVRWPMDALSKRVGRDAEDDARKKDLADLARLAIFILHRSEIPPDLPTSVVRDLIHGQQCSSAMKTLLTAATSSGPSTVPVDVFARRYRAIVEASVCPPPFSTDLQMVALPGGELWMGPRGNDTRIRPSEVPRRRVNVGAFLLARYPVTQRLFAEVMGFNPSAHRDEGCPVHNVTFRQAIAFCNALSIRHGLEPVYRLDATDNVRWDLAVDGYRLPTEAEWEYAAKGGEDRLFPWGEASPRDQACWRCPDLAHGATNRKSPSPVWNHPEGASAHGIQDLAGNVWEWCWDWYAPYEVWDASPTAITTEPVGPRCSYPIPTSADVPKGDYRILRGGAWTTHEVDWLRTWARSMDLEDACDVDIGFRVARGPKPNGCYVDRAPGRRASSEMRLYAH